jgi:hypothetical protein
MMPTAEAEIFIPSVQAENEPLTIGEEAISESTVAVDEDSAREAVIARYAHKRVKYGNRSGTVAEMAQECKYVMMMGAVALEAVIVANLVEEEEKSPKEEKPEEAEVEERESEADANEEPPESKKETKEARPDTKNEQKSVEVEEKAAEPEREESVVSEKKVDEAEEPAGVKSYAEQSKVGVSRKETTQEPPSNLIVDKAEVSKDASKKDRSTEAAEYYVVPASEVETAKPEAPVQKSESYENMAAPEATKDGHAELLITAEGELVTTSIAEENQEAQNAEVEEIDMQPVDIEPDEVLLEDVEESETLGSQVLEEPILSFIEQQMDEQEAEDTSDGVNFVSEVKTSQPKLVEFVATRPDVAGELPAPIEEVEEAIQKLAEHIEEFEVEEFEVVQEILDEFVHKTEEVRQVTKNMPEDDPESFEQTTAEIEEINEELKELFIELFGYAEIEYTEELVESFIKLAIKFDISEPIVEAEQEDEITATQGQGTHEVIKRLVAAVTSLKKKIKHAYAVGKSALNLYSQQIAPLKVVQYY